jgi:hypothetical protein
MNVIRPFVTGIIRITVVSITCLVLLNSCGKNNNPVEPPVKEELADFGIYFLKDTTITIQKVLKGNLADFELASKPWIGKDDIDFYDWSSHCIYLKKDKSKFYPTLNYLQFPKSWDNRPYVVVANKKPCYVNYIATLSSVYLFDIPLISFYEVQAYPLDVITSELADYVHYLDMRNNDTVKTTLIRNGLYHAGLEMYFDPEKPIKIINGDTASVEYNLCFKNNDVDNLYFFDPDKAGVKIFHFYTNGPVLLGNGYMYESDYKKTQIPTTWDSNWYTLIKSGELIKRTVLLKGYPYIPNGTYTVKMQYSCPPGIEKDIRITSSGRYLLGRNISNLITIYVNNN